MCSPPSIWPNTPKEGQGALHHPLLRRVAGGHSSILYGLFGYTFFVIQCALGLLISSALTLAIMVLPVIIRPRREALFTVPDSYREGEP